MSLGSAATDLPSYGFAGSRAPARGPAAPTPSKPPAGQPCAGQPTQQVGDGGGRGEQTQLGGLPDEDRAEGADPGTYKLVAVNEVKDATDPLATTA